MNKEQRLCSGVRVGSFDCRKIHAITALQTVDVFARLIYIVKSLLLLSQ